MKTNKYMHANKCVRISKGVDSQRQTYDRLNSYLFIENTYQNESTNLKSSSCSSRYNVKLTSRMSVLYIKLRILIDLNYQ